MMIRMTHMYECYLKVYIEHNCDHHHYGDLGYDDLYRGTNLDIIIEYDNK